MERISDANAVDSQSDSVHPYVMRITGGLLLSMDKVSYPWIKRLSIGNLQTIGGFLFAHEMYATAPPLSTLLSPWIIVSFRDNNSSSVMCNIHYFPHGKSFHPWITIGHQ